MPPEPLRMALSKGALLLSQAGEVEMGRVLADHLLDIVRAANSRPDGVLEIGVDHLPEANYG